jgi:hypothetical protein
VDAAHGRLVRLGRVCLAEVPAGEAGAGHTFHEVRLDDASFSIAVMQLCNYAIMQLCNYAIMQLCNCAQMRSGPEIVLADEERRGGAHRGDVEVAAREEVAVGALRKVKRLRERGDRGGDRETV